MGGLLALGLLWDLSSSREVLLDPRIPEKSGVLLRSQDPRKTTEYAVLYTAEYSCVGTRGYEVLKEEYSMWFNC